MTIKRSFAAAFALGLLTVAWVAAGFIQSGSWLALAMTGAIGAGFLVGARELHQYRGATAGLAQALAQGPLPPASLAEWLERVPAGLRSAVRQRVEGERGALPGPALTPYLVGLLVMLGMLGTFLGLVVTFKGAVFALEASTDLQAVRAALAEPIKGLGLSFGASVAGVAASAMLGLMSAVCRRERLDVARQLDARIATELRPFSLVHQRQETFRALQLQAGALPEVAARLDALMDRIEQRSQQLDEQLLQRQSQLQQEVTQAYTRLASTVGTALQDSLVAATRAAGDSIQPVVARAMTQMVQDTQGLHERLGASAQAQVDSLSQRFAEQLATVQAQLARTHAGQAQGEQQRLQAWTEALQATAAHLQAQWQRAAEQALAQQQSVTEAMAQSAQQAREAVTQSVLDLNANLAQSTVKVSEQLAQSAVKVNEQLAQSTLQVSEDLTQSARAVSESVKQSALQVSGSVEQSALEVTERASAQAGRTLDDVSQLLARSEDLVRSRVESEARWTGEHGQRMAQMADLWRTELSALREAEERRGEAAVGRLGELQAAVAQHLATLGTALEAPLSRLLHTASEVPQAAAGIIARLREEMSQLADRDNQALQERTALMAQLGTLLQSVNQASGEQRAAIESLVASASHVMEQAGAQFAQVLQAQSGQAADAAAHVGASAVELASLAEAFGHSVQGFQAGNDKLVESLQRIEASINRSTARSDEQLAYYVAQAREVIDLSIASQQGLVDHLRQLQGRPASTEPVVLADGTA